MTWKFRAGRPEADGCQFTLQPYKRAGHVVRSRLPRGLPGSTDSFTWSRSAVVSESLAGVQEDAASIKRHKYTKWIPEAGGENARINLWMFGGKAPLGAKEQEVVISKFEHLPLK